MSLKDKIMQSALKSEKLIVSEWDVEITVKELNGAQRNKYFRDMMSVDANGTIRQNPDFINDVELVMLTAHDPETGERLFKGQEDREILLQQSGVVLDRIAQVASRLSGLTVASVDTAEKN